MNYPSNPPQPMPTPDDPIQRVILALVQNINHPWQISELVVIAQMSRRTLERRFRDATEHSPLEYWQRLRMQKAEELPMKTDDQIEQIAQQVGYADVHYFRLRFKAWFKKTPSECREQQAKTKAASA